GQRHVRHGGSPQYVEVSQQAAAASMLVAPWLVKSMLGFPYERRGNPWPMGPLDCADGYVGIPPLTPTHWEMMCQLMSIGDIFSDPQAHDYGWRTMHAAELQERVRPWLMERNRQQVFEEAQAFRLPAAPFQTAVDRLDCPQLAARDFWREAEVDGRTVKVPRVSYSIKGLQPVERGPLVEAQALPQPNVGARHASPLPPDNGQTAASNPRGSGFNLTGVGGGAPFNGLRILDLTWFWSGPYAMMMLAALG